MDREVMMREAFGVREACFRFAIKPLKLSDEPYVRRGSSPPKNEMLPIWVYGGSTSILDDRSETHQSQRDCITQPRVASAPVVLSRPPRCF